jgi:hypothetical protein
MLVRHLKKGQLLQPTVGEFYLYQDIWVSVPKAGPVVSYDIATTCFWKAMRSADNVVRAPFAVYVGKTYDPIKIVGTYTSYNLLVNGKLYKIAGNEFRNLECISNGGENNQ